MININNNFKDEVIKHKGLCAVDFWAPWCGPCKMFGPIFEELSEKTDNIKFCKLNVDEDNDNTCKKYGIMTIPTIILFNNGEEIKRNVGLIDSQTLKSFLEK